MAYMKTAICMCCGESREVIVDPMQACTISDPFCSDYCRKRNELGKCEVMKMLLQATEEHQ